MMVLSRRDDAIHRAGTGRCTTKRPMPIHIALPHPAYTSTAAATTTTNHAATSDDHALVLAAPTSAQRRSMGTSPTMPAQVDRHSMGTSPILPSQLLDSAADDDAAVRGLATPAAASDDDDFGGGFGDADDAYFSEVKEVPEPPPADAELEEFNDDDVLSARVNLKEHLKSASKTDKARSKTAPRKRKTSLDKIGRLPDEVLERCVDDAGCRRSRRNKTQPLEWWRNERQEYGRRSSAKFAVPIAVITQPKEATPTWVRRARERTAAAADNVARKRSKKVTA